MSFREVPKPDPNAVRMYRYDDGYHYFGQSAAEPILLTLYVVKTTPKGFWVTDQFQLLYKWTPNYGKKRYAYMTIKEAAESYQHRKRKQLEIMTNRLVSVKAFLAGAEQLNDHILKHGQPPKTVDADSDEIPF